MVKLALKKSYEQFQYPHPHDAHEFLGFLLDQFHEGLSQPVHMQLRSTSKDMEVSSALSFWKSSFEKGYSPLVELAFSLRRKCTRCDVCKAESITWETFNMLDITVPEDKTKTYSLTELILEDGKGDEITDYHCLKCAPTKTKATVTRSNWRLGSWLIIALKRFDNHQKRLDAVIEFPLETTFTSTFHPTSPEPSFRDTYELFATVNHHGVAGGGHYTAQAKHPVTGQWNFFDDERSVQMSTPIIDKSAYVVMYRKKSD
jgi:ubiquitin C-terminal hydrolase